MVLKKYPRKILSLRTKTSNLATFCFYYTTRMKAVSIQGKQFLDDGRRKYSAKYFKWKISQNQRNQASCIQRLNHTRHWMSSLWWHGVIINFFKLFFSLVKFSYRSKFHVNIITGSEVMIIFFYKGLTKNPETPRLSFVQYLETQAS